MNRNFKFTLIKMWLLFIYFGWFKLQFFFQTIRKFYQRVKTEESQGIIIGGTIVVFALSISSGLLGSFKLVGLRVEVWNPQMVQVTEWIAQNLPRKAVFIASKNHFDVVCQLVEKVQYFQNIRMVWMTGFDFEGREDEIQQLFDKSDSKILIPKVQFILNCPNVTQGRRFQHWGRGNWVKNLL